MRVAPYCSQRVAPCCPARSALLQPARRALLQPACRALLPCASRPAAVCVSRPTAASALRSAAPRVRPVALSTACPALQHAARPARPSRAAQPEPPSPSRPAQTEPRRPTLITSPSHPAATTAVAAAAAGGGAAGIAGSVAGARGARGATGSAGGAAGAGGATRSAGGAAGPGDAGPTTDRHYLSWPLSRQLQWLGVDSGGHYLSRTTPPLSNFASGFFSEPVKWWRLWFSTYCTEAAAQSAEELSPQVLSEFFPQRCVTGFVKAAALGASESPAALGANESAAALGANESAAALGASESAAAFGARASPATGPSSTEALHTFTLDSGASRCFFCDCTTLTPLAAPVPVSLADPIRGPVVAQASTVLPCPAVPSGSLSGLQLPTFSTNLVSNAAIQDVCVDTFIPRGQRLAICQVAASTQVSASGQLAVSCSCQVLSHQTLLWHHRLDHPSLSRLRGMYSRLLVYGLPRSLPSLPRSPAPPCLPCVEGQKRAAPHSSEFPPTTAPLQTLHMDRFSREFPVLRLHSDRGGEFSSDLLAEFCRDEGIIQSFTLPASPQQNGIAKRRIGFIMEVVRASRIHAAALHFLWPFAVRYAAHQLNLWPRVSEPETSPSLRWMGKVGNASLFRGPAPSGVSQVDPTPLVEPLGICSDSSCPAEGGDPAADDTAATRRSPRFETPPGFPPRPSSSPPQPAAEDSRVETSGAEPVGAETEGEGSGGAATGGAATGGAGSGGAATGGAGSWGVAIGGVNSGGPASPSGGGAVDDPAGGPGAGQPPQPDLLETLSPQAIRAWIIRRGSPGGGGYSPAGAGAASPRGTAGAGGTGGAAGAGGAGVTSPRGASDAGGTGLTSPGGTAGARGVGGAGAAAGGGGTRGAAGAKGPGATSPRGATGARGTGPTSPGGTAGAGGGGGTAGVGCARGATGAASTRGAEGTAGVGGAGGATGAAGTGGAGGNAGAGGARAGGTGGLGGAGAASTAMRRPLFYPQPPSFLPPPDSSLTACREPATRASTPVRALRVARPRPPGVPGTYGMALCPSSVPHRVVLPEPPASSLPHIHDPESDLARAASPTVTRLLATVVTDPDIESTAAFALVTELVDFAARSRLDYVASLVTESESVCPPFVGGELALGSDVHEDRQFELECLAAALPRFASMLLCPEGDPDALDIPTPRSYAEAIAGEYSSQWHTPIDVEMASWKSTGTYVDEVPPPGVNIVNGMWIFIVKRRPGSPSAFKARYVARGFSQ
ncbi:unnamed protein product [Closterium sp. NIES-54]